MDRDEATVNKVVVLVTAGCSARSVARDLNLSYPMVLKVLKEHGVVLPKGRPVGKKDPFLGGNKSAGRYRRTHASLREAGQTDSDTNEFRRQILAQDVRRWEEANTE